MDNRNGLNIITLGTFDLLHIGHINLLKKCRELSSGGKIVVGLNSDKFITKYKGRPPVMTYNERKDIILSLGLVDNVIKNSQISGNAKKVILGSDLIVIGSDWGRKDYLKQLGINWDWLDKHGIGVCYVNYTQGISTTEIKKRLCKQS